VHRHYTEAMKHYPIDEEDFTVERQEPKVNKQEMVYKMRVDAARSIEPRKVRWCDAEGNKHSKTIDVSVSDLRELFSSFIEVPIWHITYSLGAYKYRREFFATDSVTLRDDMISCVICKKPTVAICTKCGATLCEEHYYQCKTCDQFFCETDSVRCVNCQSSFCKEHSIGSACIKCGGFVCSDDDVRCSTCNGTICQEHTTICVVCGKPACDEHKVEARYVGIKKRFCSDLCHKKYDKEYKQSGTLGKLGKAMKRRS
jgi:hypothetical protein